MLPPRLLQCRARPVECKQRDLGNDMPSYCATQKPSTSPSPLLGIFLLFFTSYKRNCSAVGGGGSVSVLLLYPYMHVPPYLLPVSFAEICLGGVKQRFKSIRSYVSPSQNVAMPNAFLNIVERNSRGRVSHTQLSYIPPMYLLGSYINSHSLSPKGPAPLLFSSRHRGIRRHQTTCIIPPNTIHPSVDPANSASELGTHPNRGAEVADYLTLTLIYNLLYLTLPYRSRTVSIGKHVRKENVGPSVRPSVRLSVCLSVCPSVCPFSRAR